MLHRIRRQLLRVRYYSAHRPREIWSSLDDGWFFAAMLAAILTTWFIGRAVVQHSLRETIAVFVVASDGEAGNGYEIHVHPDIVDLSDKLRQYMPVAYARFQRDVQITGWPAGTSRIDMPAQGELVLPGVGHYSSLAAFDRDVPWGRALNVQLRDLPGTWSAGIEPHAPPQRRVVIMGWLLNLSFWWVIWLIVGFIALRIIWLGWLAVNWRDYRMQKERARKNQCVFCGYDLRGLEFSERCPECGELQE